MSYVLIYRLSPDKSIIGVYYNYLFNNQKYYINYMDALFSTSIRNDMYSVSIYLPLPPDLTLFLTPDNFEKKIKTLLTYH